jgi:hypothetical protein
MAGATGLDAMPHGDLSRMFVGGHTCVIADDALCALEDTPAILEAKESLCNTLKHTPVGYIIVIGFWRLQNHA